jgi:hypothetical protein
MTDDRGPSGDADRPHLPPSSRRHPLLTVLMVIIGIILLLPGLCSLIFLGMAGGAGGDLWGLWVFCFVVSAGGIALLVAASR